MNRIYFNKLSCDVWLAFLYALHQVKGTKGTYIANVAVIETQQTYQITVISFNKGASWSPVTAPLFDSDMLPIECYYVSDGNLYYIAIYT